MNKSIKTFRFIAIAEGISYLLLLFVAMPLKYVLGIPEAVTYTGWAHGILFMAYFPSLLLAARPLGWGFQMVVMGVIASLLPGGTFVLDRQIVKELPNNSEGLA